MNTKIKFIMIGLYTFNLSSCMLNDDNYATNSQNYATSYQTYSYTDSYPLYAPMDYSYYKYNYQNQAGQADRQVNVPESYHVGQYQSPVSFKDRDRSWVSSQNPQGYTIEVADDEKAAQVAQKLYKAPKSDRMAQVRYQRNGKSYYKGVYGSYSSAAEAQKALDALPEDIKKGAGVKDWGSVQGGLNE